MEIILINEKLDYLLAAMPATIEELEQASCRLNFLEEKFENANKENLK